MAMAAGAAGCAKSLEFPPDLFFGRCWWFHVHRQSRALINRSACSPRFRHSRSGWAVHVRSVAGSVDILGGPDLDGSKRFKHYETYYVDEIEWTSISIILPILELTSYLLSTRRGYPQIVKGVFRRKSPDSTRRLGSSSCWRFYRWDSINQQKGIGWPYGDRIWRVFAVIWGSKAFLTVIMFVVTYLHVWSCLYF